MIYIFHTFSAQILRQRAGKRAAFGHNEHTPRHLVWPVPSEATPPPALLILGEPTNHLDLDGIAALEASLAAYDGAVMVISYDTASWIARTGQDDSSWRMTAL